MSESVSFWLDNKMVTAHKVAETGDQTLVDYRGKFYVVRNGSALMKGSKPLHYSKTSMPMLWKKALRGEAPASITPLESEEENLPMASVTKRIRKKKEKEETPMQEIPTTTASPASPTPESGFKKAARTIKKSEVKPAAQTVAEAQCPYCGHKQDIPLEKGRSGKPFFFSCSRCENDFAVRFVAVTVMQAQVAGFK